MPSITSAIDGELVAAGDEFLGAVERIDHEERAREGRRGCAGALLRQRPDAGGEAMSPSVMMRSAARSPLVTGEPSVLRDTASVPRRIARMASPASVDQRGERLQAAPPPRRNRSRPERGRCGWVARSSAAMAHDDRRSVTARAPSVALLEAARAGSLSPHGVSNHN